MLIKRLKIDIINGVSNLVVDLNILFVVVISTFLFSVFVVIYRMYE